MPTRVLIGDDLALREGIGREFTLARRVSNCRTRPPANTSRTLWERRRDVTSATSRQRTNGRRRLKHLGSMRLLIYPVLMGVRARNRKNPVAYARKFAPLSPIVSWQGKA